MSWKRPDPFKEPPQHVRPMRLRNLSVPQRGAKIEVFLRRCTTDLARLVLENEFARMAAQKQRTKWEGW